MFDKHQSIISAYGRTNAYNMASVLRFVVVTIQNRLINCPTDCAIVASVIDGNASDAEEQAAQSVLYGHKRLAVEYIEEEKEALFAQAEIAFYHATNEREAAESLVALFAHIPGLGLVKAGFAAQLLYGVGGCLDSHNIERFGIDARLLESKRYKSAKTYKTRNKYLSLYLDLCDSLGGCRGLWDSWCKYLATREDETGMKFNGNKPLYENAEHVSALHCLALGLCPETGKQLESQYA